MKQNLFTFIKNRKNRIILLTLTLISVLCYYGEKLKFSSVYQIYRCSLIRSWEGVLRPLYKPIDFKVDFYGLTYEGTSGNIGDDLTLYYGAQEKSILFFYRDTFKEIGNEGVFVDIGANVGQHSLFMSKYANHVHAFEPYPPVLERFRRMIEINSIKNITIHPVGLGNENASLAFYEPSDRDIGRGSFVAERKTEKEIILDIVKGDEEFKQTNIQRIDLIKIDIEGYEKLALLGLKDVLEKNRPIIVMELNFDKSVSFNDEADFYNTFPKDYAIMNFAVDDPITGYYELVDVSYSDFAIPEGGLFYRIVVYPKEKKNLISVKAKEIDSDQPYQPK